MLLSSLITLTQKEFPDWSRDLIREMYNQVHRMCLMQRPVRHMRMFDTSTGTDPVLTTSTGVYSYDIDTANGFSQNAWRVIKVYVTNENDPVDIIAYDSTNGVSAKIVFKTDPGTDTYYLRSYRVPADIETESDQLEIPEAFHLSHVREGVAGYIEQMSNGRSDRWMKFENKILPSLISKMNDSGTSMNKVSRRGY